MQQSAPEASRQPFRSPQVGLNSVWKAMLSSLLQHRGWGEGFHIKFQILLTNLWGCWGWQHLWRRQDSLWPQPKGT